MEGWQPPTFPPPPPSKSEGEIKPIKRPPAGAPSVGAWRFNCALK